MATRKYLNDTDGENGEWEILELYQLSYTNLAAGDGIRTHDLSFSIRSNPLNGYRQYFDSMNDRFLSKRDANVYFEIHISKKKR